MTYELSAATAKYFFVQPDQTQSLSIWPQDCWKFRNCLSTLIGRDRRAHAGQPQKIINNQTFLFLFESEQETQFIEKRNFSYSFLFYLNFFAKKSRGVLSWIVFSKQISVHPSGPTLVSFHYGFLLDCARGA